MLAQVLIAEADSFVAMWKDLKLPDGRDRVVRHGHGPHRAIQTGVGPVELHRAKVRDRGDVGAEEKTRFTSSILPKWARRTKSLCRNHIRRQVYLVADAEVISIRQLFEMLRVAQRRRPGLFYIPPELFRRVLD